MNRKKKIQAKTKKLIAEGKNPKQAYAIANAMVRKKGTSHV